MESSGLTYPVKGWSSEGAVVYNHNLPGSYNGLLCLLYTQKKGVRFPHWAPIYLHSLMVENPVQFKAGHIVITQGDPKSIVSKGIKWVTGSWWTHGFICISETEAVESFMPRVRKINIAERLAELERGGRDYVVMDLPDITEYGRQEVARAAEADVGKLYDIWNMLYFIIFGVWVENGKRLFCSLQMAKVFYNALDVRIFANAFLKLPESRYHRLDNLYDGYATPDEVLRYSDLVEIHRMKYSYTMAHSSTG